LISKASKGCVVSIDFLLRVSPQLKIIHIQSREHDSHSPLLIFERASINFLQ
jgi:hypothetical protein